MGYEQKTCSSSADAWGHSPELVPAAGDRFDACIDGHPATIGPYSPEAIAAHNAIFDHWIEAPAAPHAAPAPSSNGTNAAVADVRRTAEQFIAATTTPSAKSSSGLHDLCEKMDNSPFKYLGNNPCTKMKMGKDAIDLGIDGVTWAMGESPANGPEHADSPTHSHVSELEFGGRVLLGVLGGKIAGTVGRGLAGGAESTTLSRAAGGATGGAVVGAGAQGLSDAAHGRFSGIGSYLEATGFGALLGGVLAPLAHGGATEEAPTGGTADSLAEHKLRDRPSLPDDFLGKQVQGGAGDRDRYMGATPRRSSPTGREVMSRMASDGELRIRNNRAEVRYVDPTTGEEMWVPEDETDMSHMHDAVSYWNRQGWRHGERAPKVREFMKDSTNYTLEPSGPNRSRGGQTRERYRPPARLGKR